MSRESACAESAVAPAFVHGPAALYVTGEDNLRVTSFGGPSAAAIAIEGRLLGADGCVIPIVETHTPNTNRTAQTSFVTLAAGMLSNLHARVTGGATLAGGCFVLVELVRGRLGAVQPLGTLIQGYVSTNQRLAWPGSAIGGSTAVPGLIRSVTGTNPAAGVEISETVPTGAVWRLWSIMATLVTSAVVANRQPILIIDDGVNELLRSEVVVNETASATWRNTWAPFGAWANSGSGFNGQGIPPDLRLAAGYRIRTSTVLIDAGDDWSAPQMWIEEWIEG